MNKTKALLVSCLAVLAFYLLPAQTAFAFLGIGGNENAAAPEAQKYKIHDETTFQQNTKSFHLIPYGDTDLEFEIFLPLDWSVESAAGTQAPDLSKKIIAHIAQFGNPIGESSRIKVTVQALQLEHEIDAKSWLKHHILSAGNAPESEIEAKDIYRASGSYVRTFDGKDTHTYMTVQISGNIAMLARFEVPLLLKDYMAYLQKHAIDSFKLMYTKEGSVEEHKTFTLVDSIKFSYPYSWLISSPDFKDLNNLTVQLHNRSNSGILQGYIRFLAVRRGGHTTFKKETDKLRRYLNSELNLDFKKMLSSEKYAALTRFTFGQDERYSVGYKKGNQQDQELRLLALADPEWYIYVVMISPTEEHDLYTWARNRKTFDLIVKSFK